MYEIVIETALYCLFLVEIQIALVIGVVIAIVLKIIPDR